MDEEHREKVYAPSFEDLGGSTALQDPDGALVPSIPVTDKTASTLQLRPKKLSHRLKFIAQLAAMGCSQKEIAERMGYTQHRISVILNTPSVSNEVELARRWTFEQDAKKSLKLMLPKALARIGAVLDEPADDFRSRARQADLAFTLIEHTHGKPKQQIEQTGGLLHELYALLDARVEREEWRSSTESPAVDPVVETEAELALTTPPPELPRGDAPPALSDPFDELLDSTLSKEQA